MQRGAAAMVSGEAASTTPPASAARNFDGTVSRCFASSACSKVPRKIKGSHADERKGAEMNKCAVEAFEDRPWPGGKSADVAELRQAPRTPPGEGHSDESANSYS